MLYSLATDDVAKNNSFLSQGSRHSLFFTCGRFYAKCNGVCYGSGTDLIISIGAKEYWIAV